MKHWVSEHITLESVRSKARNRSWLCLLLVPSPTFKSLFFSKVSAKVRRCSCYAEILIFRRRKSAFGAAPKKGSEHVFAWALEKVGYYGRCGSSRAFVLYFSPRSNDVLFSTSHLIRSTKRRLLQNASLKLSLFYVKAFLRVLLSLCKALCSIDNRAQLEGSLRPYERRSVIKRGQCSHVCKNIAKVFIFWTQVPYTIL